ncbi:LytTR family DNA-binding domain-containing protein [Lactobacillus paragasseri]|mgnify:CR=1 FL=1|uniref:LytTR family DNA-binding domain-containing protein n=1 Tax=Lactobacillus paragasseri TaxID=2107999 RepID=UPI0012E1ACCD|nr:LytTR family DNA-binding domain-containing protein [Lactobacillus paragasseri]MDK8085662.1 LytTR family DNA-binding domain-containing protein [Lactobacillus paragasseri]MDX5117605.1 LytTR family DNA-binding domain-containing protein [Lactobacillus paragasseri]MDX5121485.1 LytTR family DNA-binding domain-containing protein [Lactobacillus paragasseri]QGT97756.1 LytTR family transcriptional regulator [Lactobacillus paragasseri]UWI46971.1 LytTR family transcriptional regulator [Lactobacillus pa
MDVEFHSNPNLEEDQIEVKVISARQTTNVNNLLSYIKNFDKKVDSLLPVKTEDRILTIKIEEIIKVEVEKTELSFYTTNAVIKTNGRLYQILEKLNNDFVQVSKHGIINLNYLESLEVGFTGNMIAKLAFKQKTDVSRRYLPELEKKLGL